MALVSTVTTTLTAVETPRPVRASHVTTALLALALGGFAICTTEFVTMGLLPEIANGIDESIPRTGHIISAYALGVVVGAPVIVSMGAHLPKRELAICLILALGIGNGITAMAEGYWPVMAARFVAGLPHGAYFGVASLIAASLVAPRYRGRAVSSVMLGLAVANLLGVPASTWMGQQFGWRSAYWGVLVIAIATAAAIALLVPHSPGDHTASVKREMLALREPQVRYAFAVGAVGFGGMFAMYSYIAPTVTEVTGMSRGFIPWFLLVFGLGSVIGTGLGGRLADWNVLRSVAATLVSLALVLSLFFFGSQYVMSALLLVFLAATATSALAITLQVRLMESAGEAAMLGAALNHSSLNIANGLGAYLGAVVISAGYGYRAPSAVGVVLALTGLVILAISIRAKRAHASR